MNTLTIAVLVVLALDIILSVALICRAKRNGITLKDMAFMLKDFWEGRMPFVSRNKENKE